MAGDHSWPVWQQQWQHWLDHGPLAQGAPGPKDKT
jgi:S-formylglutathione hydrolase FrmB